MIFNVFELLTFIEKRPQMYLVEKDLKLLDAFIGGYLLAYSLNNIVEKNNVLFKEDFYYYVKRKYPNEENTQSVFSIIEHVCKKDIEKSFQLFFQLLNGFKKEYNLL